ncbi:MAG TPA: hypothetical protein VKP30_26275 [Polyangiaceae bacterium]|nr:hypothetical protein [Polyangiaceae bacterium]
MNGSEWRVQKRTIGVGQAALFTHPSLHGRRPRRKFVVSSVKLVGDREVPSEEITLNFGRIRLEYRPQSPDGTLGPATVFGWDLAANKPM